MAPMTAIPPSPSQRSMFFRSRTPATLAVLTSRIPPWVEPADDERSEMPVAVIVDAVRTPGGKRNGKLKNWHAVDLASEALKAIAARNDLDPALVDDVIMGCVSQVGEQAFNVGRSAVLAAGWPESVPATT